MKGGLGRRKIAEVDFGRQLPLVTLLKFQVYECKLAIACKHVKDCKGMFETVSILICCHFFESSEAGACWSSGITGGAFRSLPGIWNAYTLGYVRIATGSCARAVKDADLDMSFAAWLTFAYSDCSLLTDSHCFSLLDFPSLYVAPG